MTEDIKTADTDILSIDSPETCLPCNIANMDISCFHSDVQMVFPWHQEAGCWEDADGWREQAWSLSRQKLWKSERRPLTVR